MKSKEKAMNYRDKLMETNETKEANRSTTVKVSKAHASKDSQIKSMVWEAHETKDANQQQMNNITYEAQTKQMIPKKNTIMSVYWFHCKITKRVILRKRPKSYNPPRPPAWKRVEAQTHYK